MNFELSEDQIAIRQMARDFAQNEIYPLSLECDEKEELPVDLLEKAASLGFTTVSIPEKYGGMGFGCFDSCLIHEELCWGDAGIASSIGVNKLAAKCIELNGSQAQQEEYFSRMTSGGQFAAYCLTEPEAGSNVAGIRTTAIKKADEYIINGAKTFITNGGISDFYVVFAVTDPDAGHHGISCFLVDRDLDGVLVGGKLKKMGQKASDTAEISFDEVCVSAGALLGKEGTGFKLAMQVFNNTRPSSSSGAVGVARRAFDLSREYASQRETFGKPISQHQSIGNKLADMAIMIEAARLLVWKAAWQYDQGIKNTYLASCGKAFAADSAMKIATEAVQIFGGYGYMREYPVEKLMRDAKLYQIFEGTSEIQKLIINKEIYKNNQDLF